MRTLALTACSLAALLCSSSAYAGGAADALSYTWTGLYGGINVGWAYQHSDWDFASGGSTSQSDDSGIVGLQVGYDAQIGNNLFAGLEISGDGSNLDGKSSCRGGERCETQLKSFGDISARLGVVSGPALFYVKGGVAYENSDFRFQGGTRDSGGALGYLLGLGAEYPLMYNLTTKLEYNYMDFGDNHYTVSGERIDVKEPINLVKLGFNFKFD